MPLAIAMAAAIPTAVSAQDVIGSGIAPSAAENSAERNVRFSSQIAEGSSLVILMSGNDIGRSLPLDRQARASVRARTRWPVPSRWVTTMATFMTLLRA